jgi:hypothetical protein
MCRPGFESCARPWRPFVSRNFGVGSATAKRQRTTRAAPNPFQDLPFGPSDASVAALIALGEFAALLQARAVLSGVWDKAKFLGAAEHHVSSQKSVRHRLAALRLFEPDSYLIQR